MITIFFHLLFGVFMNGFFHRAFRELFGSAWESHTNGPRILSGAITRTPTCQTSDHHSLS